MLSIMHKNGFGEDIYSFCVIFNEKDKNIIFFAFADN